MSQINFREKLGTWCERTTFHAVPNIVYNDQKSLKVMWTICLIASIGYCCRILTSSIIDYYEYKVLTTFEIVQESSAYFPAITLCNLNEYDMRKNKNLSDLAFSLASTVNHDQDPRAVLEEIKNRFLKSININDLEDTRFTLKDMLVSCLYNEVQCFESDFQLVKNELYGNCYLFNSPTHNNISSENIRSASKYGPKYGLQLELFIGSPESSSPMSSTTGAILFINNQTSIVRIADPGIELSPGTQNNLAINRMFTYKLPYPFSNCINGNLYDTSYVPDDEIDLVKATINFTGKYSQSYCFETCYQSYLINECNCFERDPLPPELKLNRSISNCHNNTSTRNIYCFHAAKTSFLDSKFNELCKQSCPIECERVTYKVASLSVADYPSLFYEKILMNNSFIKSNFKLKEEDEDFYENFRASLLAVNVYYDTDTYEKITETPETNFGTLLANLGGQFGLFLGISLLSFLELLELFFWFNMFLIQKFSNLARNK